MEGQKTSLDVPSGGLSRRVFVRAAGGLVVGAALSPWLACSADDAPGEAASAADGGQALEACRPFLTPVDGFFQQFGASTTVEGWQLPELDTDTHVLRIEGLVERPLEITVPELEADAARHVTVLNTMMCVLGFRDTAIWTGLPLRALLDDAGLDLAAARRVRFFGADGFENNLRVTDIYQNPQDIFEPLVAFHIYGQRLPRELGAPMRLLLADRYGFKNTKFLQRIEVTERDEETGQYQERGYPDSGVIEPVPTVENLRIREQLRAGPIELCGIALSGYAGIERVELALDAEPATPARLEPLEQHMERYPELAGVLQVEDMARFDWPPRGVWSLWRSEVVLSPGEHTLDVRVHDRAGGIGEHTTLRLTAEA